jgi:hypothetical protein
MSAWNKPIEKKSSGRDFKKTRFYVWASGHNFFRVAGEPEIVDTHFIQGTSVKCLGKDVCPFCIDNRKLWAEFGKESKNHGYNNISTRVYFNVIDRNIGKICPNEECGYDVKKSRGVVPTSCPKCNTLLASVESKRLDVIRVVNISSATFNEWVTDILPQVTDADGNMLDIHLYDSVFNSVGEKQDRRSKPEVPETLNTDPVDVNSEDLYDLSGSYLTLTADEIRDLRSGMSVRDIFAARKASTESEDTFVSDATPEQIAEQRSRVDNLLDD